MTKIINAGLPEQVLVNIVDVVRKQNKVQSLKLFGSRALGTYREGSDIDLAADAPRLTFDEKLELLRNIDDLMLPYKVDLAIVHEIDNDALIEHIRRVGITLF